MVDAPISLTKVSLTIFSCNDRSQSALDVWNSVDQIEKFLSGAVPMTLIRKRVMKIDGDHYLGPF